MIDSIKRFKLFFKQLTTNLQSNFGESKALEEKLQKMMHVKFSAVIYELYYSRVPSGQRIFLRSIPASKTVANVQSLMYKESH